MVDDELNKTLELYIDEKRKHEKLYKPFFMGKRKAEEQLSEDVRLSKEEEQHLIVSDEHNTVVIHKKPWYARVFKFRTDPEDLEEEFAQEPEKPENVESLQEEFREEVDEIQEEEKRLITERQNVFSTFITDLKSLIGMGNRKEQEQYIEDLDEYEKGLNETEGRRAEEVDESIKAGKYVKLRLYKPNLHPDIKQVLNMTDNLLAKLPKEEKIKFMQSPDFDIYKAIFKKYRIKEYKHDNKEKPGISPEQPVNRR